MWSALFKMDKSKKLIPTLEIIFGIVIFIISNILAFFYHYDKFYSIFLLGMFLITKGVYKRIEKRDFLTHKLFLELYCAFILFGIIGDLIMGVWISKVWYYPTYKLFNYILLYLYVYPIAGFIMLYWFRLMETLFIKKTRKNYVAYKYSLLVSKTLCILGIVTLLIRIFYVMGYKGFFIYSSLVMIFGGFLNYLICICLALQHRFVDSILLSSFFMSNF